MELDHRELLRSKKSLLVDYKSRLVLNEKYPVLSPPAPPIRPPPEPLSRKPGHGGQTSMIIMSCVFGLALFLGIMCIVLRIYYNRQRNSRRARSLPLFFGTHEDLVDENQGPGNNHHIWHIDFVGLEQSVIDSISVFKYKKCEGLIDGTECSVCLTEFQEDESLRLLPKCSHAFHLPCIDTWLRSHKNCPLCRAPIVSEDFVSQVSVSMSNTADLSSREEPQLENSENNSGFRSSNQAGENGSSEVGNGDETICALTVEDDAIAENSSSNSSRYISRNPQIQSDLVASKQVVPEAEMQPMRRSVSLDFSTAAAICNEVANVAPGKCQANSDSLLIQPKRPKSKNVPKRGSNGNLSFHKIMTKRPVSMKRSLSTSGKSRYSRSQNNIRSF